MNDQLTFNPPLVSVIIPAYNAAAFIEKTLISVLSQTYKNMEVIVVDDGSGDRTTDIVTAISQQDPRVILFQQPNLGVAKARNSAIRHAQGEFIAPIDADDLWHPQNIEKQVQCLLKTDSSVGLVYAWSVDIDEQDLPIGEFRASTIENNVYKTLICHNFIGNASAAVMRRDCLEKIGGYNEQFREQDAQGCEDWELYLKIAESYQFRVVPEFLIGYRKIINSMSTDYPKMAKSHALMLESVQEKHPEIPSALHCLSKSSFYMYLARQNDLHSNNEQTLFWLYQALKNDWITPFFRYGLYTLTLKSLGKSINQKLKSLLGFELKTTLDIKPKVKYKQQSSKFYEFQKPGVNIEFKILIGDLLQKILAIKIKKPLFNEKNDTQNLPKKIVDSEIF